MLFLRFISAVLHVNIKEAMDLSVKSSGYVSFNFVQVELEPFSVARSDEGEKLETRRIRNNVSPVFNELITINILPDELKEQTLKCFVYDENNISPRDLIGVAILEMDELFNSINGKERDFDEKLKWRKGVGAFFLNQWSSVDSL